MRASSLLVGASLQALTALALPLTTGDASTATATSQLAVSTDSAEYDWQKGYVSEYTIHSSCNATERHELKEGLRQAVEMAEHAKNHSK